MSDDNPGKRMRNSLLSAASTSFAFEESALLVPVGLNEEPEANNTPNMFGDVAAVTEEIDLNVNGDDVLEQPTLLVPTASFELPQDKVTPVSTIFQSLSFDNDGESNLQLESSSDSLPLFTMGASSQEESKFQLFPIGGGGVADDFLCGDFGGILSPSASPMQVLSNVSMISEPDSQPPLLPLYSTETNCNNMVFSPSMPTTSTIVSPTFGGTQANTFQNNGVEMELASQQIMGPPIGHRPPPIGTPASVSNSKENSFRLGSQRPMYAKYPGIGTSSPVPSSIPMPIATPLSPFGDTIMQPSTPITPISTLSSPPAPPVTFQPTILSSTSYALDSGNGQAQFGGVSPTNSAQFGGVSPVNSGQFGGVSAANSAQFGGVSPVNSGQFGGVSAANSAQFGGVSPVNSGQFGGVSVANSAHGYQLPGIVQSAALNPAMQQRDFYKALTFHWFHRNNPKDVEGAPKDNKEKNVWRPYSTPDSAALEKAFIENNHELISTDGGRFDVNVHKRLKYPVYWEESPFEVRRCSWFYKGPMDSRFIPYEEDLAERLEAEYYEGIKTGIWNRRLEFPGGEAIILYNPTAVSHFCQAAAPDEWGNLPESQLRPRVVKRGVEEFEIDEGESSQIDHLVFLVHGIGAICDFKLRTIVEAVDDFRHLSFQLMQSHFKEAVDSQRAGRIEFLPVSWHKALHGDGGIDKKLKPITLKSIPKLRNFTNDTLLDILFYTSPVYAQTIIDTVGKELNRLFNLFLSRNPTFNGMVAVAGHSLGSLILFDLLAHQPKIGRYTKDNDSEHSASELQTQNLMKMNEPTNSDSAEASSRMVSYTVGSGTGQPLIKYPTLEFEPTAFFALGSPIAMFVTVRGIDRLGENFHFPTCPAFFNIFHPYDPVAYRIETLIDPSCDLRPVVIPHHKGRKRFHLELKETMQRVGADLKQKFLDSLKTTWNTVYQYATFSKGDKDNFDQQIDQVIQGEFGPSVETNSNGSADEADQDIGLGKLNGGRRVDYVLQEAPLESFNEYLFALSSHVCYWESEDTMLMVMREIYASMGIFVENQSQSEQQFSTNLPSAPTNRDNGPAYLTELSPTSTNYTGSYNPESILLVRNTSTNYSSSTVPAPLFMNQSSTNASQLFTNPPPLLPTSTSAVGGKPTVIGARPVVSPDDIASLRGGWDPTAPMLSTTTIGPPPLTGFQRK